MALTWLTMPAEAPQDIQLLNSSSGQLLVENVKLSPNQLFIFDVAYRTTFTDWLGMTPVININALLINKA